MTPILLHFLTSVTIAFSITVIAIIIAFWGIRHLPEGS